MEKYYNSQSYKNHSYTIEIKDVEAATRFTGKALRRIVSGNHTRYISEGKGLWSGIEVRHEGTVSVDPESDGEYIIALADQGGWSGGRNYNGWIFGQPDAIIVLSCKGHKNYIIFDETEIKMTRQDPLAQVEEL